jgi:ribulose-phosphate 3-epimerase
VKIDNIGRIAAAGADTFVAGSAIFGAKDYAATIAAMRAAVAKAQTEARRASADEERRLFGGA